MPRTTVTMSMDEMAFLMLYGEGAVAKGIQLLIGRTIATDENAADLARRARLLVAETERHVKPDENGFIPQQEAYKYLSANYWQIMAAVGK